MENCDTCGRFVSQFGAGVSWSQTWSHDMSGCPELHDARLRCSPCTDRIGIGWTNCAPSYGGNGRNPMDPSGVPPTPAETGGDVSPNPTANSGES